MPDAVVAVKHVELLWFSMMLLARSRRSVVLGRGPYVVEPKALTSCGHGVPSAEASRLAEGEVAEVRDDSAGVG
jgi:hypothetical protein